MRRIPCVLALTVAFSYCSGCAMSWTKPGVSEQEFNADRLTCEQDAMKMYPVVHEPTASYRPAVSSKLDTSCVAQSGMNNCDGAGPAGSTPPGTSGDANAYSRDLAVKSCLTSMGYQYKRTHH